MRYIEDIFKKDGLLSKKFKNYEPRKGQIEMAKNIENALNESCHLFIEAPTGTGKSLAYGIPAIYNSIHKNKKVLIVTANIALQEQLFTKDFPLLKEILPWDFRYSLIKGKNNYLCIDKWQKEQTESAFKDRNNVNYRKILKWGAQTNVGDRSELDFEPSFKIWNCFSTTSDDCKGKDCNSYEQCFAEKNKNKTYSSNILITNYHLLFADLKIRMITSNNVSILPDYEFVICDEAHKACDIARDFFGFRVTEGSIRFIGGSLNRIREPELYEKIQKQISKLFFDISKFYNSKEYKTRFKVPPKNIEWQSLCILLEKAYECLTQESEVCPDKDECATFRKAATSAAKISSNIKDAMNLSSDNMVYFIEQLSNGAPILKGKPIKVNELLSQNLFDKCSSVISTSATLSVAGCFDHIKNEIGCNDAKESIVCSPFDFNKQSLLIVPDNIVLPTDRNYVKEVPKLVIESIKLAKGKTLCLFTSYKNLINTCDFLIKENLGYEIFKQGDIPRTMLIQKFKENKSSVLLGTESFWAGVDVPGESLSCVVIDRLPFPTPDDPVLDAIAEKDNRWFMNYSIPRAIIAFKQGFGRLIRTLTDRGVVVILDRRIAVKPYGKLFLKSLPSGIPKSQKIKNIEKFLYEM